MARFNRKNRVNRKPTGRTFEQLENRQMMAADFGFGMDGDFVGKKSSPPVVAASTPTAAPQATAPVDFSIAKRIDTRFGDAIERPAPVVTPNVVVTQPALETTASNVKTAGKGADAFGGDDTPPPSNNANPPAPGQGDPAPAPGNDMVTLSPGVAKQIFPGGLQDKPLATKLFVSASFDPTSGQLQVNGSVRDDKIRITQYDGTVFVAVNDGNGLFAAYHPISIRVGDALVSSIDADDIRSISVDADAGEDRVTYEFTTEIPSFLPAAKMERLYRTGSSGGEQFKSKSFSSVLKELARQFAIRNERIIPIEMRGGEGIDTLQVIGRSPARLFGGAENDTLIGGDADDYMVGGGGTDTLRGNDGVDTMLGDDDTDPWGGTERDYLYGGEGNDDMAGQGGDDFLEGGGGDDTLNGNAGHDTMFGDYESDGTWGGTGNDTLYGGGGIDDMAGQGGDDYLEGGGGDDTLHGNGGVDTMYGDVNRHTWETDPAGNDDLFGDAEVDHLIGQNGDDYLVGGGGDDWLHGEAGVDTMLGDDDTDPWGGTGNDHLFGGGGNDDMAGQGGNDYLEGGGGNDTLNGNAGVDTMYGDINKHWWDTDPAGNDDLFGGADVDHLYGQDLNDRLFGDGDLDWLYGGAGNDWLEAGSAGEHAEGGSGTDWNAHVWANNGARPEDIVQGNTGSCAILAAMATVSRNVPQGRDLAARISYLGNYQYTVQMYDPSEGEWVSIPVRFDGSMHGRDAGGRAGAFDTPGGVGTDEFWVTLYQRAYYQHFRGIDAWDIEALDDAGGEGDGFAMETLLADDTDTDSWGILDAGISPSWLADTVAKEFVCAGGAGHRYMVNAVTYDAKLGWLVELYNPWGKDYDAKEDLIPRIADSSNDGWIKVTWENFEDKLSEVYYT